MFIVASRTVPSCERSTHSVRKRIPLVASCCLLLALSAPVYAVCPKLPALVPDRIGRLQVFEWRIPDRGILYRRRDVIWGDGRTKIPGTFSLRYMMVDRDGDRKHDIAWYEKNHPDELVYQCDRRTIANEYRYSYGYDAPVDIDNADVRERLWSQAV